jgi:hypothetical protein
LAELKARGFTHGCGQNPNSSFSSKRGYAVPHDVGGYLAFHQMTSVSAHRTNVSNSMGLEIEVGHHKVLDNMKLISVLLML